MLQIKKSRAFVLHVAIFLCASFPFLYYAVLFYRPVLGFTCIFQAQKGLVAK